jgi:hypothetical protein
LRTHKLPSSSRTDLQFSTVGTCSLPSSHSVTGSQHTFSVLSFVSMNSTGAPNGEELGWLNLFFYSSASYFFNSAISLSCIRYGLLDIGAVPGTRLMITQYHGLEGIPGRSSGNTSRKSRTTLISSIGKKKRKTHYSIDIYLSTHILLASCNKDKSQNTFSLR